MTEVPDDIRSAAARAVGPTIDPRGELATRVATAIQAAHYRGVREGIAEAMQIASEQAKLMADLALEGAEESSRVREAMEAALTRFSQKLTHTLDALHHTDTNTGAKG